MGLAHLSGRSRLSVIADREEALHQEGDHLRERLARLTGRVLSIADAAEASDITDPGAVILAVNRAIRTNPGFGEAIRRELGR